jgi:hypothetical protein
MSEMARSSSASVDGFMGGKWFSYRGSPCIEFAGMIGSEKLGIPENQLTRGRAAWDRRAHFVQQKALEGSLRHESCANPCITPFEHQ